MRGIEASPVVATEERRRRGREDEGRPKEPEVRQVAEQTARSETEGKEAGACTGDRAGQIFTKPVGHEARNRCGYTRGQRRASEGEVGSQKEHPQRVESRVRDSGFGERSHWADLTAGGSPGGKARNSNQGRESETSLKWDLSDLTRGHWEESLDPEQDDVFSAGPLFSPEKRKDADKWESGYRRITESGSDDYEGTDVSYRRLPEIESDEEPGGINVKATHRDRRTKKKRHVRTPKKRYR